MINSKQFEKYKEKHPDITPLKFNPLVRNEWKKLLIDVILPLKAEL